MKSGIDLNVGKTLFALLTDYLPWATFTRYVQRYGDDPNNQLNPFTI